MILTIWILTALAWASVRVWQTLFVRVLAKQPLLEKVDEPRCQWRTIPELIAVYLAILWLVIHLFSFAEKSVESTSRPVGLDMIAIALGLSLGIALVVPLLIVSGGRSFSEIGITAPNHGDQVRVGILGFFAAVLPMAISMFVTLPFRGVNHQHSLLKLLSDSPGPATIALIAATAVVAAPLSEELIFRVILQSWLSTLFPSSVAIAFVAVSFSLVHGWRDGLALLPLALILGYVFDRRHSYVAVVMIHALFNATMLTIQLLDPQIP